MLKIKMHENKWRISVEGEEWEIEDTEAMRGVLGALLSYKDKYGRGVKKCLIMQR